MEEALHGACGLFPVLFPRPTQDILFPCLKWSVQGPSQSAHPVEVTEELMVTHDANFGQSPP